ncbi:hypothetical protein AOL_s00110g210 [Orbilia oligospora ATCC 24927]|uniref:BTB domain-containing protein n=1 Tax=Arthrobotrys oligospora (strain ATCC 24927 / CBS 115.81 / DSM 1491) TaxID=756982 RepID=G1XL40_ARTOA|nr:hypothetical protein AOL_s00110g210 [Orbilia oligospora ATCC 24927]EGX46046.1 hypothetical protein AOL_s00110g210 [Orbilia oligospora ATCC 24927]
MSGVPASSMADYGGSVTGPATDDSLQQIQDEEPKKPTQAQSVLKHMMETGHFTDITIVVGEINEQFRLHRAIISHTSDYFKAAFNPDHFKEGITKELELKSLYPKAFEKVVAWQYEQGYQMEWSHGAADYAVFQTVDYLQIPILRQQVLKKFGLMCGRFLCRCSKEQVKKTVNNFAMICQMCVNSDIELLGPIARAIGAHWDVTPNEVLESVGSGAYGEKFVAVMMSVCGKAVCERCRIDRAHRIKNVMG